MTTTMNTTGVDTANNTSDIEIPVDVTTTAIPYEMWWTKAPKASEEPNKNQQPITEKPETPSMYISCSTNKEFQKSQSHQTLFIRNRLYLFISVVLQYLHVGDSELSKLPVSSYT